MYDKSVIHMLREYENMLKQFISPADFQAFTKRVAREAFRIECEDLTDGDFKSFVLDNFDEIVSDD